MALWSIYYEDGAYAGSRNSGETAEQAVAEWNADKAHPLKGIEYHDEFLSRGRVENVREGKSSYRELVLCDFFPNFRPAAAALQMREIWIDGGYARAPVAA